jgi:hypothetical protein
LAYRDFRGIGQSEDGKIAGFDLDDRKIGFWICTDDRAFEFTLVEQGDFDVRRSIHHVIIGENVAIRPDDNTRSQTVFPLFRSTGLSELITEELPEQGSEKNGMRVVLGCTIFDEAMFTTAGRSFFTTGANPFSNDTWFPTARRRVAAAGTDSAITNGAFPILAVAYEPTTTPIPKAIRTFTSTCLLMSSPPTYKLGRGLDLSPKPMTSNS